MHCEDITAELDSVPDGWTVELCNEEGPEDPYKSFDMASTFWADYRESTAGQRDTAEFSGVALTHCDYYDREYQEWSEREVETWGDIRRYMEKESPGVIAYPVSINTYDHTYSMDAAPQDRDEFDHRDTGVVYITRETAIKEWGKPGQRRVTQGIRTLATQCMRVEIETYSQYASGDVWFYTIQDEDGEHIDSRGGLYGYDHAKEAAQEAVDEQTPEHHAAKAEEAQELVFQGAY